MLEEGHLPPRDVGRTEALAPMEHETPLEILPVEMIDDDFPYFPTYLILLVFFLEKFCYNNFQYPFKPKGVGTFLQMCFKFLWKKNIHN